MNNCDSVNSNFIWHEGADAISLAEHLAGEIVVQINSSISDTGAAVVAFSGGSTPKPLFKALADHDIDWSKVIITLVDERWVDLDHELSNGAFLSQYLLSELGDNTPTFVPLFNGEPTAEKGRVKTLEQYCHATNSDTSKPRKFDVVILGMGNDGHTASFFPDADNIADLVDPNSSDYLLSCSTATTQVERITWSVPMLLNTSFLALHMTGSSKSDVFQNACSAPSATELPIRSVIFQKKTPLNVYYAD